MVIFNMISVHRDFGGQGIARKLVQMSEDHLRSEHKEIQIVSAETTGALSAKIFEKQGFEEITRINYNEFKNSNNEYTFQNIHDPHKACIVWAKSI